MLEHYLLIANILGFMSLYFLNEKWFKVVCFAFLVANVYGLAHKYGYTVQVTKSHAK